MDNLEAIRHFPKEGENIPTARVRLSPNLAYSGIWSVGKFERKIQTSGPPVVDLRLGATISITTSRQSATSASSSAFLIV